MTKELRVRIEGEIPPGAETSPVRARFTADAAEDVQGHTWKYKVAPEGEDDTEGQAARGNWLKPAEDEDAEGQAFKVKLQPAEGEEAEGQGARFNGFLPVEDEDAMANALRSHVLEIDRDEDGELVGRYVPAGDDDTEGHGRSGYNG